MRPGLTAQGGQHAPERITKRLGQMRVPQAGLTSSDLALAQRRADDYLAYYHHQRPHLALDMRTPAQFITESHLR